MANYTKATDFASKDALLTGDPNKIVKGAEIDDEFANIQTAVNSKADLLSPTLTGTPLAPTATAGTNTTQIATTAYVINERTATATLTNKTITGTFTGSLTGNADTATKLATARTLSLTGDVSGSASFDGSANATITATVADDSHNHVISNVDGLQSALDLKAPLSSPALTGTPTAPTASFGTSTTQLATTAFVQAALSALYPVGTIYTSTSGTNPASTFGFGTWEAFGAGKVLVGQDTGDTSFDTLGETGGSKDAIVVSHTHTVSASGTTSSEGAHTHTFSGTTGAAGAHSHTFAGQYSGNFDYTPGNYQGIYPSGEYPTSSVADHTHSFSGTTASNGAHTHTVSVSGTAASSGSSGTNANLQPYIVVKMWKRTA